MAQNLPLRDSTEQKNSVNLTGEEKVSRAAIIKGKCSHPLAPMRTPGKNGHSGREGERGSMSEEKKVRGMKERGEKVSEHAHPVFSNIRQELEMLSRLLHNLHTTTDDNITTSRHRKCNY